MEILCLTFQLGLEWESIRVVRIVVILQDGVVSSTPRKAVLELEMNARTSLGGCTKAEISLLQ